MHDQAPYAPTGALDLEAAAADGSATAQALLAKIESERAAAASLRVEAKNFAATSAADARTKRIEAIRAKADELLDTYQGLADAVTRTLLALADLDHQLPGDCLNRVFSEHLARVNVVPARPGPFDERFPNFTTMQAALQRQQRTGWGS